MNVDGIGNIDIVWGTPGKGAKFKGGYGLSHILAKRNDDYEKGCSTVDGKTTANKLIEVIAKGKNRKIQNAANGNNGIARMKINYDSYTAVLSMAQGEKNTWLLTGWEDDTTKKEAPVNASSEGYDSATATTGMPTLTRHTGETSASSTSNISQEQKPSKGKVKKKGTERAGTEGNETVTEGNGGEVSSEHTQGTETVQSVTLLKRTTVTIANTLTIPLSLKTRMTAMNLSKKLTHC